MSDPWPMSPTATYLNAHVALRQLATAYQISQAVSLDTDACSTRI